MANLTISVDALQDLLAIGESIEPLFQRAQDTIKQGGKVIVQYEYFNAPPDVEREISTQAQLDDWRLEIDPPKQFYLIQNGNELGPVHDLNVSGGDRKVERIVTIGGKPTHIMSKPTPVVVTFIFNGIVMATGSFGLSNKHRLDFPILIDSINTVGSVSTIRALV